MYVQLLTFLLLIDRIILNGSSVITVKPNTVSVGDKKPVTLPAGYTTFTEDQAAYKIHEELATWEQARERCISEGARLAITDSRQKIAHINSIKNPSGQWLHVGIYNSSTANEWVRVDNGLPLTSVPWAANNPDGTGSCVGISFVGIGLVDYPCDAGTGEYFVCEIPL